MQDAHRSAINEHFKDGVRSDLAAQGVALDEFTAFAQCPEQIVEETQDRDRSNGLRPMKQVSADNARFVQIIFEKRQVARLTH